MGYSMVEQISICVQTGNPALLVGAPGIGKTSQIMALARALGIRCEVFIGSIHEPSDLTGLPIVVGDQTKFSPPEFAVRLAKEGKGILFLDELSCAPPAVQAAMLRVALEKVIGYLQLPEGVSIVAAMNPPSQTRGGFEISPPLANRFVWLYPKIDDVREWAQDFVNGFPVSKTKQFPDNWRDGIQEMKNKFVAPFFIAKPQLSHTEDPPETRAYPSPRSWDMVCQLVAGAQSIGYKMDDRVTVSLITGCVGDGATSEFLQYVKTLDLPDPEEVLKHPEMIEKVAREKGGMQRPDRVFSVLSSVVQIIRNKTTPERWLDGCKVIDKAATGGNADLSLVAFKKMLEMRPPSTAIPTKVFSNMAEILAEAGLIGKIK
jgi:MoxR-like ATPase